VRELRAATSVRGWAGCSSVQSVYRGWRLDVKGDDCTLEHGGGAFCWSRPAISECSQLRGRNAHPGRYMNSANVARAMLDILIQVLAWRILTSTYKYTELHGGCHRENLDSSAQRLSLQPRAAFRLAAAGAARPLPRLTKPSTGVNAAAVTPLRYC
jgi:hypothetical protein